MFVKIPTIYHHVKANAERQAQRKRGNRDSPLLSWPHHPLRLFCVKRLILASFLLLVIVVVSIWGDRILSRTLDAKLGPLLTQELGLPVQLAPIKARLFTLKARTPRLVMGDPDNPAVVATDVEVTLAWSDLLNREIRLVHANASDLMLQLSNWPSNDNPWPDDYRFLDPWLPQSLKLATGRYVDKSGDSYPVKQALWQRKSGGSAALDWSEDRAGGEIGFSATLKSLVALLRLSPIELELAIEPVGNKDARITLQAGIQPAAASGYTLDTRIQAAGMNAHVAASNTTAWRLPATSITTSDRLEPKKLQDVLRGYTDPDTVSAADSDPESWLASALPQLSLPNHKGNVTIDEIRINDEAVKDTTFEFRTGEQGLTVSSLTIQGPNGILQGDFGVISTSDGWQLNLTADMTTRDVDLSIAPQYLNANWLWHAGNTQLKGQGDSWGALLNSLKGNVKLDGFHRGKTRTPVNIRARLDNDPGKFMLDQIEITVGKGRLDGSMTLSGTSQRKLTLDLQAEQLQLDFLFDEQEETLKPGIPVPEYLGALPGMELDLKLGITGLRSPAVALSTADIRLVRDSRHGQLLVMATGLTQGTLDLRLDAKVANDKANDIKISAQLTNLDIPEIFQQEMLLHSRSTGTIAFNGKGTGLKEIFQTMQGKAQLTIDFRDDNDWQRESTGEEQLVFAGDAKPVVKDDRILGLQISNLDIDSIQQELTGSVSMVTDRTPWLIADLESERLDIKGLLEWVPESPEQADQTDLLTSIKDLGSVRLSLNAQSVITRNAPVEDMVLEVTSGPNILSIDQFDFTFDGHPLKSRGKMTWSAQQASLEASVSITDFDLDQFLIYSPSSSPVPVSGTIMLQSEGTKFAEMLGNISGEVSLAASQEQASSPIQDRRIVDMKIKRVSNGMHANINRIAWGESELTGSVKYRNSSPPMLEVEIHGGALSLLPWESARAESEKAADNEETSSTATQTARKSADFVGNFLLSPARLFGGPGEAEPGEKYFDSTPLPLDSLQKYNASFKAQIGSLASNEGTVKALAFNGTITDGVLSAQATVGNLNRGKVKAQVTLDTKVEPASVHLTSSFENIYGKPVEPSYPGSGFISLTSHGHSEAELAANLNGQVYLESGKGPYDFRSDSLLNADIASTMLKALIPGTEKREPELECGVTLATFKDGIMITPYGYALQTNEANLIGRVEVDLKKELMQVAVDSRSRRGVGISVGSVFSNTVRIKGPITDPQIVPNTTGIIWRGWAAFMTVGLSVVGESVFKRALASENPCESIKKDMRKDLCKTDQPIATSPLACPRS